jgi:hypothetical protein
LNDAFCLRLQLVVDLGCVTYVSLLGVLYDVSHLTCAVSELVP